MLTALRIDDAGLKHILGHYGTTRADVYKRIFQILWFGARVGDNGKAVVPTYVYPDDLKVFVRQRFPDGEKGRRDEEFDAKQGVFHVSWERIAAAKWPKPPKSCSVCNVAARKPY